MTKVIILGGGIAGLSTAIALHRNGINVEVFEKTEELKPVGAGIMLAPNAIRIFNEWGITDRLRRYANPLLSTIFYSDKGRVLQKQDLSQLSQQMYAIHRADLHKVLLKELKTVPIHLGKRAVNFQQNEHSTTVYFDDGDQVHGDLIVAADGIHSIIRKQLLPNLPIQYAGYTCWRGVAEYAGSIHLDDELHEIWGANGRFGYVPISKTKVYWYMLVNALPNDKRYSNYTVNHLIETLPNYPQPVHDILQLTNHENVIKHDIFDIPDLKQYAFERVVLVGDAAHAMTPNLGQGACQGIEDGYSLGRNVGNQLVNGLKFYEKNRLTRASKISKVSRMAGKLAQLDKPFLCKVRNMLLLSTPSFINERQSKFLYEDYDVI
ncbi:FAD-dependent monooxygenase [Chengkuizengella axinellae]|uniref:FAD-dependent monooxygenase n=1 Tax=Chengkuizengella axinellae TaxID=3064388 RepID=A0ABT9J1H7_9BACL|nr:FAD-dependent monooxygenase [Chengkuizengella sp. 2205SS18-9]MDP5275469.1 FAD-dependent monooxygenase [Chengkuizengella sp. 2205SS18-9]